MQKCFLIALLFALPLALAAAQEPPLPSPSQTVTPTAPAPNASPSPTAAITPPPLLPDPGSPPPLPAAPTQPDISVLDAVFQAKPLSTEAQAYRLHLKTRELQNIAGSDPVVIAAKQASDKARTDLQKRSLLRIYYTALFDRMTALAKEPDVKQHLKGRKTEVLTSLDQPRVRPTPAAAAKKP